MPTLTIDDIKVEVPEGTTVLQAARQAGVTDVLARSAFTAELGAILSRP